MSSDDVFPGGSQSHMTRTRTAAIFVNTPTGSFLVGCLVGAVAFIMIWGATPLNIYSIHWMHDPYWTDFSFASNGAQRFLREPWSFPLGLIRGLIYPLDTSIVYIDGVPLFGLLAKLMVPLADGPIQYFGPWGFFCCMLQGGLSSLLLFKYRCNILLCGLACIFFILCPFFLGKMFGHVSMSGQWLILLAIANVWYRDSAFQKRHRLAIWTITIALSVSVLPYFTPMVGAFLVLDIWLNARDEGATQSLRRFIPIIVSSGIASILTWWLIGGILPGTHYTGPGYGDVPLDLDALVNPGFGSYIFKGRPQTTGDGYGWLGAGIVAGAIFLIIDIVRRGEIPGTSSIARSAPYVMVSLGLLAFGMTNNIHLGGDLLLHVPLPHWSIRLLSNFRSSARFVWPVWDLVVIAVLGRLCNVSSSAARTGLCIGCLLFVQIGDGLALRSFLHRPDLSPESPPLHSAYWTTMGRSIGHLSFIPDFPGTLSHQAWGYISSEAIDQNVTLNQYWLGRVPTRAITEATQEKFDQLKHGTLAPDEAVVVNYMPLLAQLDSPDRTHSYLVDDEIVVSKSMPQVLPEGVKAVSLHATTLADYLDHISLMSDHTVVILTARQNSTPVNLNDADRKGLEKLGIAGGWQSQSNFTAAVIAVTGRPVLNRSGDAVTLNADESRTLLSGTSYPSVELALDLGFSEFPKTVIAGTNVSRTFLGLNIAVYDTDAKRVVEVGTFHLFWSVPGVYYSVGD